MEPTMSRAAVALLALIVPTAAHATDVLVVFAAAGNFQSDVMVKLNSSGLFTKLDQFDATTGTPSAGALSQYDAVLVYSDAGFIDPTLLGNRLADYVDGGGGVVQAVFANGAVPIQGRFDTANYEALSGTGLGAGVKLWLNAIDPNHPILDGVGSFNGGSSSYHTSNAVVLAGATEIARWTSGVPLVAVREDKAGRIAGLNFYPPSSTARNDFWDAGTDGDLLLAQSLDWVAHDDVDTDLDGLFDDDDNCPEVSNPLQEDADADGLGDACDFCNDLVEPDSDGDGVCDAFDVCPGGSDVRDSDSDSVADGCDICPNADDLADADADALPDACDACPQDPVGADDDDGDAMCNHDDRCDGADDYADRDGDEIPDGCDNCPDDTNRPQNDEDGDGYGKSCDCDDTRPEARPNGIELCNGLDEDCDGLVDEDGAIGPDQWFADEDGDGQGAPGTIVNGCEQPANTARNPDDCDDHNPLVYLGAPEFCDDRDTNCDGSADDSDVCVTEEAPPPLETTSCGSCASGDAPSGAGLLLVGLAGLIVRRRR